MRLSTGLMNQQAARVATQYVLAPLLPRGRSSASPPPSRRSVAVVSHAQYALTVTAAPASRVKAALSKAACSGDLLTLVSESRVTWATFVPILVLLGLSVLELGPMYATDTSDRRQTKASLNAPAPGRGYNN